MLLNQFLILGAAMFALGIYGLLVRRNIVLILLSVELMLNAVNINLVAFESVLRSSDAIGQVFAIFVTPATRVSGPTPPASCWCCRCWRSS